MTTAEKIKASSKGAYDARKKAEKDAVLCFTTYMSLGNMDCTFRFRDGSRLAFRGSSFEVVK